MTFPERLKRARRMMGVTQGELADLIGCSRRAVCKWETGMAEPQPRLLRQYAIVTGQSIPWLLGEESSGNDRQDQRGQGA